MLSDVIEEKAVNAVKEVLTNTEMLEPKYINSGDKMPSWDGSVLIYDNTNTRKKENLKKVDVQVKGFEKTKFPKNHTKESVNLNDLKNYAQNRGVIYFVVYENATNNTTKIYYQTLTPVKIYAILDSAKGQASKRIEFDAFPEDNSQIIEIFLNFFQDARMQASFTPSTMLSLEQLQSGKNIASVSIPLVTYGNSTPEYSLLHNEVYLYAKKLGTEIPIPVYIVPKNVCIASNNITKVSVDGVVFPYKVMTYESRDKMTVKIGDVMNFDVKPEAHSQMQYKLSKTLNERVEDVRFLLAILKSNGFELNDARIELSMTKKEKAKFNEKSLIEHLTLLQRIQELFKILHIKNNLDISKLSDKDNNTLGSLIRAFLDHQPLGGISDDYTEMYGKINIGNIKILLVFLSVNGAEKGTYYVYDFFDPNIRFVGNYDNDDEHYTVPVYAILTPKDYNTYANIDYDGMLLHYDTILKQNSDLPRLATAHLLNLLSAYDISGRPEQLEAAEKLSSWIIANSDETGHEIDIINELQIVKRKRELTDEEKTELMDMLEEHGTSDEIKLACSLLLDNQLFADRYFAKLTDEQKQMFMDYPIYKRFWQGERK